MSEAPTPPPETRRGAAVAIVIAVAFIGFFVGIRQEQAWVPYSAAEPPSDAQRAPPARSHRELARQPWRTERASWTAPPVTGRAPVTPADPEAHVRALEARAQRRAYDGAPPTIPHPVSQASGVECLACHAEGAMIAGRLAPPMSHEPLTMCTQCHAAEVPGVGMRDDAPPAATVGSTFEGARRAPAPLEWAAVSPPQTPHRTHMRERCASCHGPAGRAGLQTSHPERQVCQQCHASAALVDQRGRRSP